MTRYKNVRIKRDARAGRACVCVPEGDGKGGRRRRRRRQENGEEERIAARLMYVRVRIVRVDRSRPATAPGRSLCTLITECIKYGMI